MAESMITITGVESVDRILSRLPSKAQAELSKQLREFAAGEPARIKQAARRAGRQAAMVAQSVRSQPGFQGGAIVAGGSGPLPGGRGSYGDVFFGAEFGGSQPQFKPYRGHSGYWFYPQLHADDRQLEKAITEVLVRLDGMWTAGV